MTLHKPNFKVLETDFCSFCSKCIWSTYRNTCEKTCKAEGGPSREYLIPAESWGPAQGMDVRARFVCIGRYDEPQQHTRNRLRDRVETSTFSSLNSNKK